MKMTRTSSRSRKYRVWALADWARQKTYPMIPVPQYQSWRLRTTQKGLNGRNHWNFPARPTTRKSASPLWRAEGERSIGWKPWLSTTTPKGRWRWWWRWWWWSRWWRWRWTWKRRRRSSWSADSWWAMGELIERSGLANFWPIKKVEVKELISRELDTPERDRWIELKLRSTSTLMIRIHSLALKKIYDFEDGTMDRAWIYGRTFTWRWAYLTNGQFQVISGYRMGSSSPYLDVKWTGATLFVKVHGTWRAWAASSEFFSAPKKGERTEF